MAALKIKLIKGGCAALTVVFIAGYMYFIRQENKRLTAQATALRVANAASLATIAQMKALDKLRDVTLTAWETANRAITDEQTRKATYVQKELRNNESFGAWAGQPVPDAVKRLFAD